jgi:hypothetical protein
LAPVGGGIPLLVQRHQRNAFAMGERRTPSVPPRRTWLQPAPRTLAQPVAATTSAPPAPPPSPVGGSRQPQPQPQIDLARLSEEVYRQIERRARIERERRGI